MRHAGAADHQVSGRSVGIFNEPGHPGILVFAREREQDVTDLGRPLEPGVVPQDTSGFEVYLPKTTQTVALTQIGVTGVRWVRMQRCGGDVGVATNTRCLEQFQERQSNSWSAVTPPSPHFTIANFRRPRDGTLGPGDRLGVGHQPISTLLRCLQGVLVVEARRPRREEIHLAGHAVCKTQITASTHAVDTGR